MALIQLCGRKGGMLLSTADGRALLFDLFPFISSFYVYLTLERFRAFVAFVWETRPSWET